LHHARKTVEAPPHATMQKSGAVVCG
jgi:hypothetical protein